MDLLLFLIAYQEQLTQWLSQTGSVLLVTYNNNNNNNNDRLTAFDPGQPG